ncbi:MAG: hypothetical protein JNK02_15420 [Planctomycetes bacterium]|nr:hypothetical protein [Planctomycetota bacterium]
MWAGFDLAPEERAALLDLVERGRALAARCGVALDGADLARPFTPHLTLTRLRQPRRAPGDFDRLRFDLDWLADEVHLFESAGGAGSGPRYPVRATCRLRGL